MQARMLWTGRKLLRGQAEAGKSTDDRKKVIKRAG
jgi:hypothetical protein